MPVAAKEDPCLMILEGAQARIGIFRPAASCLAGWVAVLAFPAWRYPCPFKPWSVANSGRSAGIVLRLQAGNEILDTGEIGFVVGGYDLDARFIDIEAGRRRRIENCH